MSNIDKRISDLENRAHAIEPHETRIFVVYPDGHAVCNGQEMTKDEYEAIRKSGESMISLPDNGRDDITLHVLYDHKTGKEND